MLLGACIPSFGKEGQTLDFSSKGGKKKGSLSKLIPWCGTWWPSKSPLGMWASMDYTRELINQARKCDSPFCSSCGRNWEVCARGYGGLSLSAPQLHRPLPEKLQVFCTRDSELIVVDAFFNLQKLLSLTKPRPTTGKKKTLKRLRKKLIFKWVKQDKVEISLWHIW